MPREVNGEAFRFIYLMSKLINNAVLRCQLTDNNINLILVKCRYFRGFLLDD